MGAVGVLLLLLIPYHSLTCWNKGTGPEGIRRGLACPAKKPCITTWRAMFDGPVDHTRKWIVTFSLKPQDQRLCIPRVQTQACPTPSSSFFLWAAPTSPYTVLYSSGCSGSPWPPDLAVSPVGGPSMQQPVGLAEEQASIRLPCVSIAIVTHSDLLRSAKADLGHPTH